MGKLTGKSGSQCPLRRFSAGIKFMQGWRSKEQKKLTIDEQPAISHPQSTSSVLLGRTGIKISMLGLGTRQWGNRMFLGYGKSHDERDIHEAFQTSLERLGVMQVDLYQIHFPYPLRSIETWLESLADAFEVGLSQIDSSQNVLRVGSCPTSLTASFPLEVARATALAWLLPVWKSALFWPGCFSNLS
jgi:hypothetical protein